jgi:hypothetical protein
MTTPERTMVTIAADHIGTITMTPAQFRMFVTAAMVGLDGFDGSPEQNGVADRVWEIIAKLEKVA